mgnify:CR=1 FL=1
MKNFQKLALVAAISAAPFAQAELTAIDDSALSDMTGQAGVSIELDTSVTIGNIKWTDTDGNGLLALSGGAPASGTLSINTIAFGGSGVAGGTGTDRFDDIKIDIDVDGADGLVIHLGGTDTVSAIDGSSPVDFGLSVGDVSVSGLTNPIVSDIQIAGNLGPVDIKINNKAGVDLIQVGAYFEVTSGSMDVSVMGMGIDNLKVGQDTNPFSTGGYGSVVAVAKQISTARADGSANQGTDNGTANMAYAALAIGTASANYYDMDMAGAAAAQLAGDPLLHNPGTVTVESSLMVTVSSLNIDVSMDLSFGKIDTGTLDGQGAKIYDNQSIGLVEINDLNLSGTTLKIYGH